MPKNIHNIKTFLTGIVSSPDAKDIPEDAAESSLNIDPVSSDGRLQSIGGDFNIVEEQTLSRTPDVFNFVNVDGSRLLVGANTLNNSIQTLDNVSTHIDDPIHGTTEPRPLIQTPVGTIKEPTIVVNNNESYVGLGSQGASRPQFVGKVMTPNVTNTSTSEVVIEDAENKPLDVSYYKINKIATTIPATDSAFGNTKSTELKYVWGVGNGNNFLYRITVDEDDTEGTIVLSNIIKDGDGINIPTNLVSIATCISQNNMLWATGEDQKIYRLHVNATTNNVTIESIIELSFNKQAGAVNGLQFNESNKPPPDDAVLSDIIEAKNADGTKSELVISYFKEDGFSSRESYMYSRTLTPWNSSDIVEDNPDEFLEDPANLISDTEIITRTYFENFLFRDISTIFDDVSIYTTQLNVGNTSNSFDLAFRTSFLTSEGSSNQVISTQEVVRTFPDETNILTSSQNADNESIGPCIGFKQLIINTNNTYPFKQSSGEHIYKNDADFFTGGGNVDSETESVGYKRINARDFEHTSGDHTNALSTFSLGKNLGFEAGFRLKVNKYGLVATNESESLNEENDIYVHLFSTCDKKFIIDGGSVFVKQTTGFSNGKNFFGASNVTYRPGFNRGFFISTKASYGVDEYRKPFYVSGFNNAETSNDEGNTSLFPFGDESTTMAASCLPHESEFGQTDISRLGEAVIVRLNGSILSDGGFDVIDEKSIFESFAIDRFGERNSLTTNTTFAPADNENIVFMSLSEKSGISERFTKTTLYVGDFDSIELVGGLSDNGLKTGRDSLRLAKNNISTFITPKTTTDLGGACIFPIFNTASLNHGGAGANDYRIWMFSLHSAGSNNYRNGIQDTQPGGDSNLFNDFNGNFTEKQTAYSSLTFDKDTDGDEHRIEDIHSVKSS